MLLSTRNLNENSNLNEKFQSSLFRETGHFLRPNIPLVLRLAIST